MTSRLNFTGGLAQCSSAHAVGAEDLGFHFRAGQIRTVSQRLVIAATFIWSCVGQSLGRGDGPRHSSHALATVAARGQKNKRCCKRQILTSLLNCGNPNAYYRNSLVHYNLQV